MLNSPICYFTMQDVFTQDECQKIIHLAKTTGKNTTGKIGGNGKDYGLPLHVDEEIRKTELFFFSEQWVYDKLMPHMAHINRESGWNFSLSKFEALQLGIYSTGGHYDWHIDENPYPYDAKAGPFEGLVRKLSFSVLLNDNEYTGGDFEIEDQLPGYNPRSTIVEELNTAGSMIVFPSFTPHKVHPVTSGIRYSLVGWICGQPWR